MRAGILDTSVVIDLESFESADLPDTAEITAVTLGELSVGPLLARGPSELAARLGRLQWAESTFDPLPYDAAAARIFGRISASQHLAGRTSRARNTDLMIAATAMSVGLPLYTRNPKDFAGVEGLELFALR